MGGADAAEVKRATAAAMALLARRDYSSAGLKQRLTDKGYPVSAAAAACARCAEAGYLDDRRYGTVRLERLLQRRPSGRRGALDNLRRQGLTATMSESIVAEVFAEAGGEEAVLGEALRRWRARHGEPSGRASAKRCFDHLLRRRFPRSMIRQALSPWLERLAS